MIEPKETSRFLATVADYSVCVLSAFHSSIVKVSDDAGGRPKGLH